MAPLLPTRRLGKDGPNVTALGYGAMGLSAYGKIDTDDERLKFLDHVYELGCTNWDTADTYTDSEDLIGKWFKRTGKRDEIFLATKFGTHFKPDGTREFRNDPDHIKSAIDRSLKRLQTDYVDLWYCHRLNGKIPVETVVAAMAEAVKAGKVKYLGLSECSSESLRRAQKIWPIQAVQIEYSPFTMDIENPKIALLKTCRELGVATIAYSPLGRGMLTGQYRSAKDFEEGDWRRTAPRFSAENFPKNLDLVDRLMKIANQKGCTTGQLTLAWLMNQGQDIIPIPGTKKIKYLEENIKALDVKLTTHEDKEIREAVETAETHGDRYPGFMNQIVFMDTPLAQE